MLQIRLLHRTHKHAQIVKYCQYRTHHVSMLKIRLLYKTIVYETRLSPDRDISL